MIDDRIVTVRPRRSLIRTGLISVGLAMIPLFGVLYWFSIERGSWQGVLAAHVVAILITILVVARQLRVFTAVTGTELIGNGIFSPLIRVPLDDIAAVHLVDTYVGQAPESVTQLLVTDASGQRLFRMRGSFYREGELQKVAAALPVSPQIVSEPMDIAEFFRTYPGSAYWFDHRPVLRAVLVAIGLAAALVIAAWIMTILGLPLGFAS